MDAVSGEWDNPLIDADEGLGDTPIAPGAPKLLALGGCMVLALAEQLADYAQAKHYWRHNIVCDMSGDVDVSGFALDHYEALRLLDKYSKKLYRHLIVAGDFDWLLMECTSDVFFRYQQVGDAVLPDVRNVLFADGWQSISFDAEPALRDAPLIRPTEPLYWDMWKRAFTRLYDESLAEHVRAGKKIIFVRRWLCTHYIGEEGRQPFAHGFPAECNLILQDVFAFLGGFPGLTLIDVPEHLYAASKHAPMGGPWEAHPEAEFYDYATEAILRSCVGKQAADRFRVKRMALNAEARVKTAFVVEAQASQLEMQSTQLIEQGSQTAAQMEELQGQGARIAAQVDQLKEQASCIASQADALRVRAAQVEDVTARLDGVTVDREHYASQWRQALTDRDRFAARVALLEKRYAPVRAIYKGLGIGRVRSFVKKRPLQTGLAAALAGATTLVAAMASEIVAGFAVAGEFFLSLAAL